jgi:hypothetical protein
MQQTPNDTASTRELHDAVFSCFKDLPSKLADLAFKQSTILLITIGWLVTSERTQELLANSIALRLLGATVIVAITTMHMSYVFEVYRSSLQMHCKLVEMKYMPDDNYDRLQISRSVIVGWCMTHLVISVVIVAMVWLVPNAASNLH